MESRFQSSNTDQNAEWTSEAPVGSLAVENVAAEAMEPLGETEEVEILGKTVSQELQQRRKMTARAFIGFISYGVGLSLIMTSIVHYMGRETFQEWITIPGNLVAYTVLTMGLPICGLMISGRRSAKRTQRYRSRRATERLAKSQDIRSIGPLVDSLSLEAGRRQRKIIDALIEQLPKLRADQADLLNAAQQARL
jgi:hypothetical protein